MGTPTWTHCRTGEADSAGAWATQGVKRLPVTLRPGTPEDAEACGRICFDAFAAIAQEHNFPPDFTSVEVATRILAVMLGHDGFYTVVAEQDGRVIGSNFLDERCPIAGLGPITVAPDAQDNGVGRRLVADVLERSDRRRVAGMRLVQAAYHGRSMALYLKLGFQVREPLVAVEGPPTRAELPGYTVRTARSEDVEACERVCVAVHGHERSRELRDAITLGSARVVVRHDQITGYATTIGFAGYAVGRTSDDVKALIAAADRIHGPGFLLPIRDKDLVRWCLDQGLRIGQPLSLMSRGLYQEPEGAFLPSIAF